MTCSEMAVGSGILMSDAVPSAHSGSSASSLPSMVKATSTTSSWSLLMPQQMPFWAMYLGAARNNLSKIAVVWGWQKERERERERDSE